ncbi:MAG: response regulator, partial [Pseudomonadota bacterium]
DARARLPVAGILETGEIGDEPLAALAQIITLGPAALGLLAGEDCEAVMALREAGLDETELPVCDEPVRPSALHTMLTALGADAAPADDADNAASGTMRRRGSRPASPRPAVDTRSDGTLRHPSAVVLVAEDNRINRLVIGRLLEGAVGEVLFAENGEEAVVLWRSHAPDLVLMDLQMPVLDGYGAARAIRAAEDEASRPRVPIVALTANVLQDDRGRCLDAGIDDFLDKPLRRETLLQRLDHWLPDQPGAGVGHTAA